jgi:hypothetical protein
MRPKPHTHLLAAAERWQRLSAWERAELGRALRLLGVDGRTTRGRTTDEQGDSLSTGR